MSRSMSSLFLLRKWKAGISIVYPLSEVKGKMKAGIDLYKLMHFNPITPIIETFKHGALSAGEFIGWGWLAYSFVIMLVVLALGIVIFNKVQKSFMDTV